MLLTFPYSDLSKQSQGRRAYWLLTNNWRNTCDLLKGLVWKEIKYLHAWLGQSPYLRLSCHLLPPSTWFKGLLHACCCPRPQPLTGLQDLYTFTQRVSKHVWSGSTRGAFFKSWKYKLKAYVLSKHDMPRSRAKQRKSASLSFVFRYFAIMYSLTAERPLKSRNYAWQLFVFCLLSFDMTWIYFNPSS